MKFENTSVFNFDGAFRGMRNPLESWDKSDSFWEQTTKFEDGYRVFEYRIGHSDIELAQKLIKRGSEHRKFMRQIFVSVDITAPDYFFKEFDTYKVGTVSNSTSTMHRIMSKPFTVDMFECADMRGYKREVEQKPNEIDIDSEVWRRHPVYSDYEVSNQGRVKRLVYVNLKNKEYKERILTGSLHSDGYVFVTLCLGTGKYKQVPKHRLVAECFLENMNNYKEVNHKDGNKQNNCVDNLEWCSREQNQQHACTQQLQPKPVTTYKGKLSKAQRDEIVTKYNTTNTSIRKLAEEYGVAHTTICSILNNKYNYGDNVHNEFEEFKEELDRLNELRDEYLLTKDKEVWKTLIERLPMNYLYKRTVTMNYENLLAICSKGQRRFHKLTEWSNAFIDWARTLPYAQELIFIDEYEPKKEEENG